MRGYVLVWWMINLLLDSISCNKRYIQTLKIKAKIGLTLQASHNLFALNFSLSESSLSFILLETVQLHLLNLFQSLNYLSDYSIVPNKGAFK